MARRPPTSSAEPPARRRHRLLVAVLLEGRVAAEVSGIRRAIGGSGGRVGPHVTLVPPTNVADDERDAALAVVRDAAAASPPLALELGPPATFPRGHAVLFLAVGGDVVGLDALRRAATKGPLAPPSSRPARPFVPHVTLATGLTRQRAAVLVEQLASYRAEVTSRAVSVLEEVATPSERRWSPVASEVLGGRAVRGRGGLELEVGLAERLDPEVAAVVEEEWVAYERAALGEAAEADQPYAFVARRAGVVVGAGVGARRGETCGLDRLVVVAAERGQGIGSKLLEAVVRYAAESGCNRVRLCTVAGGAAVGFFDRRGFTATATLTRWRKGHDLVVMERAAR